MKTIILILLSLLLFGCATSKKDVNWYGGDFESLVSTSKHNRDTRICLDIFHKVRSLDGRYCLTYIGRTKGRRPPIKRKVKKTSEKVSKKASIK